LRLAIKDVSFVLDAVDEMDPWLEHTRSPAAVARAYRDYVLARCNSGGLKLSDDEYQLIQVWFGASQWSSVGQQGGAPTGQMPGVPEMGRPQLGGAEPRSFGREGALPPPDPRSDIPLPPDFGFDREADKDSGARAANQRFSFLKH
jgi:hypothetical protein